MTRLRRDDGSWAETREDLCEVSRLYFEDLFSASEVDYGSVIAAVECKLDDSDNNLLTAPFDDKEFKEAAF